MKRFIIPLISGGAIGIGSSIFYYITSNPVEDLLYGIFFGSISFVVAVGISFLALYVLYPFFFLMIQDYETYKTKFSGSRNIILILIAFFSLIQIVHPIIKIDLYSLNALYDHWMDIIVTAIFLIFFFIGIYKIFLSLGFEKEYYHQVNIFAEATRKGISLIFLIIFGIFVLVYMVLFSSLQNLLAHIQIQVIFFIILIYIFWISFNHFAEKYLPLKTDEKDYPPPTKDFFIPLVFIGMIFGTVFLLCLFSWQLAFNGLTSISSFQGSISIDMKNRYSINDSPIYASVQMTGPDTGLLVSLKSESSDRNYDAFIYLDKNNESMSYKNLNGRVLGGGKYSIIVNTSDMVTGNYILGSARQKYGSFKSERFFLSNN